MTDSYTTFDTPTSATTVTKNLTMTNLNNPNSLVSRLKNSKLYSLDIETTVGVDRFKYANGTESNHPGGLDPRVSPVSCVAVTSDNTTFYIDGNERSLLPALKAYLETVDNGVPTPYTFDHNLPVIVGWNILYFDAPFLAFRFSKNHIQDCGIQLRLKDIGGGYNQMSLQKPFEPKYGYPEWAGDHPLPREWNFARMMGYDVVDISPFFKKHADDRGIRCSLKDVAKSVGLNPVEINIEEIDSLSKEERMAYNISDTKVVLDLIKYGLEEGLFE